MSLNFKEALHNRRSYYSLDNTMVADAKQVEEIVKFALDNVPSAFNSQSTRMVILLWENHTKLWNITKDILSKMLPAEAFSASESKINNSFASGCGTILFFEDQDVVKGLQEQFPLYADNFPIWSNQTSSMHQLAVWTMLEELGFGASLQHYNPLIDDDVHATWSIPKSWKLIAEMPFGNPIAPPLPKTMQPASEKMRIFK